MSCLMEHFRAQSFCGWRYIHENLKFCTSNISAIRYTHIILLYVYVCGGVQSGMDTIVLLCNDHVTLHIQYMRVDHTYKGMMVTEYISQCTDLTRGNIC